MVIRVLFADQSATIQKLAARAFAQEKIEVIRVGNGDLATWLLDEINPQLVVAEVSLPDTDGYELCHFIKDNPRLSHIPVLLLHWSDETFDHTKADSVRADGYLTKPFESRALIDSVRRLLEGGGGERKLLAFPQAPLPLETNSTESIEPPDTFDAYRGASPDASSQAADSEPRVPFAIEDSRHAEESPHALDGALGGEPILEHGANEEAPLVMALHASGQEPEAIPYSAPYEEAPRISPTGPEVFKQRPIRSPLAWAVLAIIVLSSILGIWQAKRIRETRPGVSQNANGSGIANSPQAEQPPQDDSDPGPDAQTEDSPPSESAESETYDPSDSPVRRQSSNRGNAARSIIPRPFSLYPWSSFSTNSYQARSANSNKGANINRSTDSRARNSNQARLPESDQASTAPANNDKLGPSPVRIIQVPAASPAPSGKPKAGAAARQDVKSQNGFQQIGSGVKGAVVWSGKKAGRGLKAIARELKKVFKHDRKLD
jgi:twitching motility two-component system response regulator PilH